MNFTYFKKINTERIKIVGVGDAGLRAVNRMIDSELSGLEYIAINTNAKSLEHSKAEYKIQIGSKVTSGLGTGGNPKVGREAAMENIAEIKDALSGCDMVFIAAGFGGGTGTGVAPVVAEISKESGFLTVAVVTKPFSFEGKIRIQKADEGVSNLLRFADTVLIISNNALRKFTGESKFADILIKTNEVLLHSVKTVTELILRPGYVNLDFADVKTTMSSGGVAFMGTGVACGDNRVVEAVNQAISHPLLEDISLSGAKRVLLNVTSSRDITMEETINAAEGIMVEAGSAADLIWGHVFDKHCGDKIQVTVIVTGIRENSAIEESTGTVINFSKRNG